MASWMSSPVQSSLRRVMITTTSRGPLASAMRSATAALTTQTPLSLAAPSRCTSTRVFPRGALRPMSSNASGGDSTGRFSDDLEKLIARAGAKVDRSGKSSKAVVSAGEEGAVVGHAAGGELEGRGQEEDGAEGGVEGGASSELSARAMKFRAMISKLRPQKKTILVKTFSPSREPLVDNLGRSYGLGRRKASSARVWISMSEGKGGVFTVNSRPMIEYFPRDHLQNEILKPLEITEKLGLFHIRCTATGGGQAGQAGAIRLGLSRALEAHDPWLRRFLKKAGMMERDARKVERKKTGLKKARKAPQWVKR